jgi:nifR3 family TIM-barrel protein
MAGVTDAAMRLLCAEMGAAWSVSEMISAKGWVLADGRNENARELLMRLPGEGIVGLQLFGREPDYVAEAARRLEHAGFDFIDLNFGCPAPKITGNGEGSALLKEPLLLGRIVRAAADAVSLPVTAKIRSGWDASSVNAVEIARICQDSGAAAVAVHGRTREQHYAGEADWSVIAQVKRAVRIPVLGNGDVRSGADAVRMLSETGCDGVLVARAAQGNPWVFRDIRAALEGRPSHPPTPAERVDMVLRHFDLETQLHGQRRGMLEMRKHVAWYVHGLRGAARFRDAVMALDSPDAVRDALREFALRQDN